MCFPLNRIGAERVYCLLRGKKNLTGKERVEKMCSGPVSLPLTFKWLENGHWRDVLIERHVQFPFPSSIR